MPFEYAVSVSALNLGQLREELAAFRASGVNEVVVDVMDGDFAPDYGFGRRFIETVAEHGGDMACHVHLMAREPERRIEGLVQAGAALVTVHAEACVHAHRVLDHIRSLGAQPGIALRPATPLTALEYLLPGADRVVLMTDEPGFAAREPIAAVFERIKLLRDTLDYREWTARLEVKAAPEAYALARMMAAGAQGAILEAPLAEGPNRLGVLTADAFQVLQRDALSRSRALDMA